VLGFVRVKVRNHRESGPESEVELLADTRAIHSIITAEILEGLRIERRTRRRLADGRVIETDLGISEVELNGEIVHSTVIFGESDDAQVLGVAALDEVGLQVDQVTGELKRMELLVP